MTDATTEPEARVLIGRISGLYGVQGWVKLYSYTQPRDNLLGYREVELGQAGPGGRRRWTPAELLDGRRQGKTLVARIAGVRRWWRASPAWTSAMPRRPG
jgi:16S rRNA processing protein RimM